MALYLTFKAIENGHTLERQFHVGAPLRERFVEYVEKGLRIPGEHFNGIYKLMSIFADGDELDYIRSNYKNIPISSGRSCHWFGETCQFILANWSDDQRIPSKEDTQPPGAFRQ